MHLWTVYVDFAYGIGLLLLLLYGEADKVLGFTLGAIISKACDFEATILILGLILNVALGSQWNDSDLFLLLVYIYIYIFYYFL